MNQTTGPRTESHIGHGAELLGEDIHDPVVEAESQEDGEGLHLKKSHRATIIAAIVKGDQEVVKGVTGIEPAVDLIQMNDTQDDGDLTVHGLRQDVIVAVSLAHLTRGAGQRLRGEENLEANGRDTGTVAVRTVVVRVDQTESWRRPTNVPREAWLNNSLESMTSYLNRSKTSSICSC